MDLIAGISHIENSLAGRQANGHGKVTTPDNETRHARFPLSNFPPQARERANESLREFHVNHGEKKPARKNIRVEAEEEQKEPAEVSHSSTEYDSRLGRKLDTNA